MLYNRDYNFLTDKEIKLWEKAKKLVDKKQGVSVGNFMKYFEVLPKAAYHYQQLFPNNLLDIDELKNKEQVQKYRDDLADILNADDCKERDILNYIRDYQAYPIIGSIFHLGFLTFRFGHHEAFLFREFPLPPNHIADFLLVGKNSHGYHFIYIELESPKGLVTTKDGDFGDVIRKGIRQIEDWDTWLEANYSLLQPVFEKYIGKFQTNLPKEFYKLDKSRLHYVVIAGRRKDFQEKTYTRKRQLLRSKPIHLLHYDNLIDCVDNLLLHTNY